LPNRHINTLNAGIFLVDDRVNSDCRFTNLAITNDQFALTTTDGNHRVNGFEADLYWLVNGLPGDNAGSNFLQSIGHCGVYRSFAVNWDTKGIDYPALKLRTHRYFQNTTRATASLALCQALVVTQNNRAYRVALQVQRHSVNPAIKLYHFAEHHVGQTVNADNTVGYRYDGSFIASFAGHIELVDALFDNLANL